MSCQHRRSRNLRRSIPLFSSPTWTFRSDPFSPFSRPSQTRPRVTLPGSLQSIHGCSDDSTRRREQSQPTELVFDIRYQLSCEHCEHLAYLTLTLNSLNLQLPTKVSVLSCICVIIILIWICVRPAFIHAFIMYDEMLHSGTYIGIGRSQTAIGSCFRDLLTSTWSA
jgi:hypothetical protein